MTHHYLSLRRNVMFLIILSYQDTVVFDLRYQKIILLTV